LIKVRLTTLTLTLTAFVKVAECETASHGLDLAFLDLAFLDLCSLDFDLNLRSKTLEGREPRSGSHRKPRFRSAYMGFPAFRNTDVKCDCVLWAHRRVRLATWTSSKW